MKKSILGGLSAALLSLAIVQVTPAYAMHKPHFDGGKCILKKIDQFKAELSLTPDQEKRLKAIRDKSKAFMEQKHKEQRGIRKEAHQLSDAKHLDEMRLNKLADKAGRLESDVLKNRVMTKYEVNQILNQQQKDQLKHAKKKMHKKMDKKAHKKN